MVLSIVFIFLGLIFFLFFKLMVVEEMDLKGFCRDSRKVMLFDFLCVVIIV